VNQQLYIIHTLRKTAQRLATGAHYDWSHHGSCNCGHLVQTVTSLPKEEIHARALEKAGDWGEKVLDYCPTSDFPIDHIISTMLEMGFTRADLYHLERLSSPKVLERIPEACKPLQRNRREHLVLYLNTWANLVEEELRQKTAVPKGTKVKKGTFC